MNFLSTFFSLCFLFQLHFANGGRSFTVDYDGNTFLKDGQPFRYVSGCIHYFRIPRIYWKDRLLKMKAGGLDAIETYIPWNFHSDGSSHDFSGQRDVVSFLNLVNEVGLLAIVRGFPYADTEWDMGGLPYWLLKSKYNPSSDPMILRTHQPKFMSAVEDWLGLILPKLQPLLYKNNGPIIMVQVENEYGSYYAHDQTYMKSLYNTMKMHLGEDAILFTTDGNGNSYLEHGGVPGALQTVDFGPGSDPNASFAILRKHLPKGPLVNSEYYTGWLDHWGESGHHRTSSDAICSTFESMLKLNASVNFYMFAGGSNFGYWSGSNYPPFKQIVTSYDYDSPISENGDTTDKYFRIRDIINKYKPKPLVPVPANITRMKYGMVKMSYGGQFWDHLNELCSEVIGPNPKSFEDLSQLGGYVLYSSAIPVVPQDKEVFLTLENDVRDYAQVYINRTIYVGNLQRGGNKSILLPGVRTGDKLDILVESRGRVCYGSSINDSKGILGEVKLTIGEQGEIMLNGWGMCPLQLEKLKGFGLWKKMAVEKRNRKAAPGTNIPGVYFGYLPLPSIGDTFVRFPEGNWTSGYILADGWNLGKYEPKSGPQKTLYLPIQAVSKDQKSVQFVMFETRPTTYCSTPGNACAIDLVDVPDLG